MAFVSSFVFFVIPKNVRVSGITKDTKEDTKGTRGNLQRSITNILRMKSPFAFLTMSFVVLFCLKSSSQERFSANWESLKKYKTPDWFMDAKFGIFIHWGVYSVPAFSNEWYPRNMYRKDSKEYKHHIE